MEDLVPSDAALSMDSADSEVVLSPEVLEEPVPGSGWEPSGIFLDEEDELEGIMPLPADSVRPYEPPQIGTVRVGSTLDEDAWTAIGWPALDEPRAEEPAAAEPIAEEAPVAEPVMETLAAEAPAKEPLVAEEPTEDAPVEEAPVAEAAAAEAPVAEASAVDESIAETPTAEEPAAPEWSYFKMDAEAVRPAPELEPEPEPEPDLALEPFMVVPLYEVKETIPVEPVTATVPVDEAPATEETAAPAQAAAEAALGEDLKSRIEETRRRIREELEKPFAAVDEPEAPAPAAAAPSPFRPAASAPAIGEAMETSPVVPPAAVPVAAAPADPSANGADYDAMKARIELTRSRLKAKAFDAMMAGESALLGRDEEEIATAAKRTVTFDSEIEQTVDNTLREEDR